MTYSEIFSRAWGDMKNNLAFIAGLSIVVMLGSWFFSLIPIIGFIFTGLLSAGYLHCLNQIKKGKVIGYGDFFWAFLDINRVIKILILSTIVWLGTIVGFICLIIPGIWWMIATSFASAIFVLKNQDPIQALQESMKIVKGRWWYFFGLMCLVILLNAAGALCLLLGLLLTIPMTIYLSIEVIEHFYSPLSSPTNPVGETQLDIAVTAASPEPPPIA